ncbi:MATE family efflux transporter [Spirochaetia bacterium]|nr:MATE family efflux transporter [Spirochaetia bacterium]
MDGKKGPNWETALDRVEAGPVRSDGRALPEGITSKMLYRDVVKIAFPSMGEMVLVQLASMVDLMMVGQLGPWALTSVGLATQPKFLVMILFMAMNVGATAMVARYRGAGNPEKANMVLRQALLLNFILGIASSVAGYIFAEDLIRFMGAPDAASLAGGTVYFQWQCIGLLSVSLTSTATATLRGVGNSRTSMVYNIVANIVNVIFNYLLIYGNFGFPRWEVMGASVATIIGQFVALALAMITLLKGRNYIRLRFTDSFRPNRETINSIFRIGLPALAEQAIMRTGMISYTKIVTSLGTMLYATHMACMNIQAMSFMIGQAFAVSATALTGQSLGKRRPDMAEQYTSRTRRIGLAVSVVLALIFVFLGRQIMALYVGRDPESLQIIETGSRILRMVAIMLPFQSSQFILAGALRGAGDTRSIAAITFITVLLVRPGIAGITVMVLNWSLWGAWIALILDQLLRSLLVLVRYNSGKWKTVIKG